MTDIPDQTWTWIDLFNGICNHTHPFVEISAVSMDTVNQQVQQLDQTDHVGLRILLFQQALGVVYHE